MTREIFLMARDLATITLFIGVVGFWAAIAIGI